MRRFVGTLVLGVLWSVTFAASAEAGCNAIPSVEMLSIGDPLAKTDGGLARFGFKGALGRIDRVHLIPGEATSVTVVPDGICVDEASRRPYPFLQPLPPVDDLVTLLYFPTTDGKRSAVRAYASETACLGLSEKLRPAAGEPGGVAIELLPTCSSGVKAVTVGGSSQGLTIPLPSPNDLERAFANKGASPDVRILVARANLAAEVVKRAATHSCRELCGALIDAGGLVCIDDIFTRTIDAKGQPIYSPDPVPCNVQMPTGLQPNDFAKGCENEDATIPQCQQPPSLPDLKLWQDRCGGIHIPVDWKGIRPGDESVKRVVRGRSGVGRKKPSESPRIWVPGREFLGSTPLADPQGTGQDVDWRKPDLQVWVTPDAPQEFGLQGTVDQDDSIVHVFPRLRSDLVCAGTAGANACMGIERQGDGGFRSCACTDRKEADCTCDPPLATARYFVCGSGKYRGMPCTRDRHCNPDGLCNGKPHCHGVGDVWLEGTPDDTGKECTVDDDCNTESVATQCGYRLFNLEDGIEHPEGPPPTPKMGVVTLDTKVRPGGGRKRRGACKSDATQPCGNGGGAGNPSACAQGDCRGYVLEAGVTQ